MVLNHKRVPCIIFTCMTRLSYVFTMLAHLLCLFPCWLVVQEHLQGYKLPKVWEDLLRPEEVVDLMRTTCNRPLKIVNMIAREV